ncbi:hypothetical protein PR202_ga15314 [Eleusine coracana subsp. coracana]|uniref:Serine aminopeptidase S33 domain-containing protein n=1 Tax=Eleusine coracana subsp. coracana TaxID=191504 RepID=A0AAV5CIR4_ELECO|nr:hypothetical protein PR202_ga15314 [Eleusine coracana subsp. coracana]
MAATATGVAPRPLLPRAAPRRRALTQCRACAPRTPASALDATATRRGGITEYMEAAREMARRKDGGPARWFTPLECGGAGGRVPGAPTLLYLPGIDGVGLGLIRHHERLAKMFELWCLHIPVEDRTSFEGLVEYVEKAVKSETSRAQDRPVYLVGESVGACIALAVAARNPDIDLVLILVNPGNFMKMPSTSTSRVFSLSEAGQTFSEITSSFFPSLMEAEFDLATTIKGAGYYRRSRKTDFVSDYQPPNPDELEKVINHDRILHFVTNPVMLSTLPDGKIVRGLAGLPKEGPAVLVGYHMLLGLELGPLVTGVLSSTGIHIRGLAHPFMFDKNTEKLMPDSAHFDLHRIMGAVPVTGTNFYKLLAEKQFVLLYPGGAREALHRKVLLDYDDLLKLPFYDIIDKMINQHGLRLRTDSTGELKNQEMHPIVATPKLPGRFYFIFGKPIQTRGREKELRDKEKAQTLYLHVKSEVEGCINYLKEKREEDPYRSILSRLLYQATHGPNAEIPTFEP